MNVVFTHERPPIPTRSHDWRAGFEGREEEGRDGFGATKLRAAVDLYQHCETPEEVLACIVAALRAERERVVALSEESVNYDPLMGFDHALAIVEGIA